MILHLKRRKTALYLYFNYKGREVYISTGERIPDEMWNEKERTIRAKIVPTSILQKLKNVESDVYKAIAQLEAAEERDITPDLIRDTIRSYYEPRTKMLLEEAVLRWEHGNSSRVAKSTIKKVAQLKEKIKNFSLYEGHPVYVEDFDRSTFNRFEQWLSSIDVKVKNLRDIAHYGKDFDLHLSENTIATHASALKSVLNFIRPNEDWSFVKHREMYYNVIYLFPEEIETLENAEDLFPYMRKARDLFLIMYYSGVRFSDLSQLNPQRYNHATGTYNIVQTKTNKPAYPPFTKALNNLLAFYGGCPPAESCQKLNTYLKALFRFLELDRKVSISVTRDGKRKDLVYPLYDVISCHVARKTFIMTLLSKGIPQRDIMDWTGHSDFNSMKPYITLNQRALAERTAMLDNEIFVGITGTKYKRRKK